MKINSESMTVDQLISKIFWLLAIGIFGWGATKMDKMSESVEELNKNMAVMISTVAIQGKALEDHSSRIHDLEINEHRSK